MQEQLRQIENVNVPEHILSACNEHIIRGRKDMKQSSLIRALYVAKREDPNITIESLYYIAFGFKEAQR